MKKYIFVTPDGSELTLWALDNVSIAHFFQTLFELGYNRES